MKNSIGSVFLAFLLLTVLLSACSSPAATQPAATLQPPTAAPTAIPPTATMTKESVLTGPFTLTVDGNQLVITWEPGEISVLLSKYVLVGGFLFRKTGVKNADGSEQVEVTAINIADSAGNFANTGTLTLSDLKSGGYIININGTTANLQAEKIADAEFEIP